MPLNKSGSSDSKNVSYSVTRTFFEIVDFFSENVGKIVEKAKMV